MMIGSSSIEPAGRAKDHSPSKLSVPAIEIVATSAKAST